MGVAALAPQDHVKTLQAFIAVEVELPEHGHQPWGCDQESTWAPPNNQLFRGAAGLSRWLPPGDFGGECFHVMLWGRTSATTPFSSLPRRTGSGVGRGCGAPASTGSSRLQEGRHLLPQYKEVFEQGSPEHQAALVLYHTGPIEVLIASCGTTRTLPCPAAPPTRWRRCPYTSRRLPLFAEELLPHRRRLPHIQTGAAVWSLTCRVEGSRRRADGWRADTSTFEKAVRAAREQRLPITHVIVLVGNDIYPSRDIWKRLEGSACITSIALQSPSVEPSIMIMLLRASRPSSPSTPKGRARRVGTAC